MDNLMIDSRNIKYSILLYLGKAVENRCPSTYVRFQIVISLKSEFDQILVWAVRQLDSINQIRLAYLPAKSVKGGKLIGNQLIYITVTPL